MLLFWRIRYLDSRDREFKDRDLWLDTSTLDAVTRAAVELCSARNDSGSNRREWLRYRQLFREERWSDSEMQALVEQHGGLGSVFVHDYFEDENSQPLSSKRMAEILTGSPTAILLPAGARQHDVEYALADKRPIPIEQITLSADDLRILGYFSRDLREMLSSAFYRDGPGSLHSVGNGPPELRTAVTDEEIRSFITIFRRLYMTKEPAGFLKAVEVFSRATSDYPLGRWCEGSGADYQHELQEKPWLVPFVGHENVRFSRKRLIDVFLYTRYAHQPDATRERQYRDCLAEVGGRQALLTWLFLRVMWECSLHMRNAGLIITDFFNRYCEAHGATCAVLASVAHENPGIGYLEKKEDRERRLLEKAVSQLASQLWEEAGRPEGGPAKYAAEARSHLLAESLGAREREAR